MVILKIARILNIILLTILLCLLLWFFIESYINNAPETYVLLIYPALMEIIILILGIVLMLISIKHRKKTTRDILIFYFLIPGLVFIGILLDKIGIITAMTAILVSIVIQIYKIAKEYKLQF